MSGKYFKDALSDETIINLTDELIKYDRGRKANKKFRYEFIKLIAAMAAVALVIGGVNFWASLPKAGTEILTPGSEMIDSFINDINDTIPDTDTAISDGQPVDDGFRGGSKEINGITLTAYTKEKITDTVYLDFIDKNIDSQKYGKRRVIPGGLTEIYDINGQPVTFLNGSYLFNAEYKLNTMAEIGSIKMDRVYIAYENTTLEGDISYLTYDDFGDNIIEIPIPKDGETLYTDITYPIGNYIYRITEVRREGDIIYFEDNQIPTEVIMGNKPKDGNATIKGKVENGNITLSYQRVTISEEEAVRNEEAYIYNITLFLILDEPQVYPNPGNRGIISQTPTKTINVIDCNDSANRLFDIDAETLRLGVGGVTIVQYGDFTVEFE